MKKERWVVKLVNMPETHVEAELVKVEQGVIAFGEFGLDHKVVPTAMFNLDKVVYARLIREV